jgi:hypothetical protein
MVSWESSQEAVFLLLGADQVTEGGPGQNGRGLPFSVGPLKTWLPDPGHPSEFLSSSNRGLEGEVRLSSDKWHGALRPGQSTWNVFDQSGIWLGTVEVPPALTLHEVGADYILGSLPNPSACSRSASTGCGSLSNPASEPPPSPGDIVP